MAQTLYARCPSCEEALVTGLVRPLIEYMRVGERASTSAVQERRGMRHGKRLSVVRCAAQMALTLFKRFLRFLEFVDVEFQLRSKDFRAFVQPDIVNGGGGGNGKRLCETEMLRSELAGGGCADGEQSEHAVGGHQRYGNPAANAGKGLGRSPGGLLRGVRNEDALAFNEHALEQGVIRGSSVATGLPVGCFGISRATKRCTSSSAKITLAQSYGTKIRKAGEESIEDGIHRQILRKSQRRFSQRLGLSVRRFGGG